MEESYVWNKDHCLKYWWSDSKGMFSWAAACKCSIKLLVIGIFGERLLCWAHLRIIKLCCHHMFVFGDKNKEINLCLFINLLLLCNKFRDFVTIFLFYFLKIDTFICRYIYIKKKGGKCWTPLKTKQLCSENNISSTKYLACMWLYGMKLYPQIDN